MCYNMHYITLDQMYCFHTSGAYELMLWMKYSETLICLVGWLMPSPFYYSIIIWRQNDSMQSARAPWVKLICCYAETRKKPHLTRSKIRFWNVLYGILNEFAFPFFFISSLLKENNFAFFSFLVICLHSAVLFCRKANWSSWKDNSRIQSSTNKTRQDM